FLLTISVHFLHPLEDRHSPPRQSLPPISVWTLLLRKQDQHKSFSHFLPCPQLYPGIHTDQIRLETDQYHMPASSILYHPDISPPCSYILPYYSFDSQILG